MTIPLRQSRLLLAAACVSIALGLSPSARGQAASAATQQKASPERAPLDVSLYEELVDVAGREDARIQADIKEGKAPIVRRDYATEIGISADEEQTMLSIVIDAFYREFSLEQQRDQEIFDIYAQYDRDEARSKISEVEVDWQKKRNKLLKATVDKLRTQLGVESFAKITKYSKNGKLHGNYVNGVKMDYASLPDPCPPNSNPPPGQTTHLGCADLYDKEMFDRVGWIERNNSAASAEQEDAGRKPGYLPLFGDLPEDKREEATAICLEADREIKKIDALDFKKSNEFTDQNVERYGPIEGYKVPPSPELEALWEKRATTLEEYIFKLKQVVGDDFFNVLDTYISKENKHSAAFVRPAHAPGFQGTPAVKP
jgi:hypothetical protein